MLRDKFKHKPISAVALLIEQATNGEAQQEENWSMFMHIADLINKSYDEGAKDAAKAIRKKLGCKVPENICLTLKLLETCMKNCGRLFHVHVATSKFMQEMIKVINPKYHPSIGMQNTVLGLIQAWAQAFKSVPELREFSKAYQDLKLKGVEFPPLDPEMAMIGKQPPAKKVSGGASGQTVSDPDLANKLVSELAAVRNNCKVFSEMLREMKPGQETASDLELLEDLNMTSRQMQKRITELLETAQFEQQTEELLLVNDELNNVFLRYDRRQRMRAQLPSQPEPFHLEPNTTGDQSNFYNVDACSSPPIAVSGDAIYDNPSVYDNSLIDLGPDHSTTTTSYTSSDLAGMSLYDDNVSSSGFDPFVIPSQSAWQQPSMLVPGNLCLAAKPTLVTDTESDLEEMEKWLKSNPRTTVIESNDAQGSDEFERFLSSRAREIERLPSVNTSLHTAPPPSSSTINILDQPLFSL